MDQADQLPATSGARRVAERKRRAPRAAAPRRSASSSFRKNAHSLTSANTAVHARTDQQENPLTRLRMKQARKIHWQMPANPIFFKGCRIVFNGRTGKVSSYNLAKLVQEHGGNVASALTTTRVTHMVGSNLNGSKADKVLKNSSKFKFVTPEWILQSVRLQKRQPEFAFLVYKDSRTLCAAFSQAASSTN